MFLHTILQWRQLRWLTSSSAFVQTNSSCFKIKINNSAIVAVSQLHPRRPGDLYAELKVQDVQNIKKKKKSGRKINFLVPGMLETVRHCGQRHTQVEERAPPLQPLSKRCPYCEDKRIWLVEVVMFSCSCRHQNTCRNERVNSNHILTKIKYVLIKILIYNLREHLRSKRARHTPRIIAADRSPIISHAHSICYDLTIAYRTLVGLLHTLCHYS